MTLEQVKDQLVTYFNQQPSPLVTGIGLGHQQIPSSPPDGIAGQPIENAGVGPHSDQSVLPPVPQVHILVFVEPVPDCELQPLWDEIRSQAQGQPFVLLRTGRFVGLQAATGTSISPYAPSRSNVPPAAAGTLGAVVTAGGKEYILSCNHVLAYNGRVPFGTPVVAPGTLDDPYGRGVVGRLSQFVELLPAAWPFNGTPVNPVDCALAEMRSSSAVGARSAIQIANPVITPTNVKKQGRTSGTTQAVVSIWSLTLMPIDLSFGAYCFSGLMGTIGSLEQGVQSRRPFAVPGDSGALVLTDPANE
ncbi:MAG: hypothetical protein ACREDR_14545, partial [Blastocatellia bacterium]